MNRKNKKWYQNRTMAWGVLGASVLISVVGLGGNSLAAQQKEAMQVFNDGVDTSFAVRFSMDAYLDGCAEYARTMGEEYRLHGKADDETAAKVLELADDVAQDGNLSARRTAYDSLCGCVETLYTNFVSLGLSDSDSQSFLRAYSNFSGEVSKIEYDGYHTYAENFNRDIQGVPAKLVSSIWGLGELDSFR